MSDSDPRQDHKGEDGPRVVITVLGAGLVIFGLAMLARQWFWPYLPFERFWGIIRGAGWGLGLIIIGVIAIVWTRRPGFSPPPKGTKIYRSRTNRMISGVLGGLAEYLRIDATLLRLGFVALMLMFDAWPAIVAYVAASIIVPEAPVGASAAPAPPVSPVPPAPPVPSAAPPPPQYAPPEEMPSGAPGGPPADAPTA